LLLHADRPFGYKRL